VVSQASQRFQRLGRSERLPNYSWIHRDPNKPSLSHRCRGEKSTLLEPSHSFVVMDMILKMQGDEDIDIG